MIKDPDCKNTSYRISDLDEAIISEVKKLQMDPKRISAIKKDTRSDDADAISKQITTISRKISRLLDLYADGTFSMEELDEKIKALHDQRQKLTEDLKKISDHQKMTDAEVTTAVQSFAEAMDHGTLQQRRLILQQLINKIEIDGDEIIIHWNFT